MFSPLKGCAFFPAIYLRCCSIVYFMAIYMRISCNKTIHVQNVLFAWNFLVLIKLAQFNFFGIRLESNGSEWWEENHLICTFFDPRGACCIDHCLNEERENEPFQKSERSTRIVRKEIILNLTSVSILTFADFYPIKCDFHTIEFVCKIGLRYPIARPGLYVKKQQINTRYTACIIAQMRQLLTVLFSVWHLILLCSLSWLMHFIH